VFNPGTGQYPGQGATEGSQVAFSNGGNVIAQGLATVLQADTNYTLQVDVGDRTDTPFPAYSIELFAGGIQLTTGSNATPPDGGFATSTATFNPGSSHPALGAPLEIRLTSNGVQMNFDNVRLDATPIPEPAGLTLLAGAAALGLRRRRQNR
jgi:MYXO-CTERM domain-containing protein